MNSRKLMGSGLVSLFLLAGTINQTLYAGENERALEYRQGLMNVLGWNMKSMGDMMKGKKPYDKDAFARHAADLAQAASLDIAAGFPEGSDEGETDARVDIWLDFADFEKKLEALREASRNLSEVASAGNKAANGEALGKTGKSCKSCHDSYKD